SGAVRVVLKTLDRCRNVELATLEVDQTVRTLVAATNEASRNTTVVVAAALLGQTFGQTLDRLALVETGTVHDYELARTRRNRIVVFQCHRSVPYSPVVTSIDWPSASVTTALLTSLCLPMVLRKRFTLP